MPTRFLSRWMLLCGLLWLAAPSPTLWAQEEGWKKVIVPDVWKRPPAGKGGYSWYRCAVQIPASWSDRSVELFAEPVDDVREYYLNGNRVGQAGNFPPQFQSGLGGRDRHPAGELKFGESNVLAIRIYNTVGRTGFNVAAPVLFGGEEAIRCAGEWEFRPGDDQSWAAESTDTPPIFRKIESRAVALEILRRLPGEEGPLPVEAALKRLQTPEDLIVEPVLAEPHIGQPLFMEFDERGRMWVLNYKQYPNPAGLKAISRDKYLRTVYDKVPQPPPHHVPGKDAITIHTDTDGDGVYDKHQTFVDGLNIASSFAKGRGGVFVMNPPYLLFYPDADQDDVPDGDPEVLLEGFGLEDSHSIANNLCWGPDGWLYAAQGSTVTGQIRRYGTKDPPVHSMGQLIWRYHPESRRYEIFAEGGGNTFGVEFDAQGRVFSGHNGGDTRGFHYVQGGYYQKGFGKHGQLSNPFAFGYFPFMKHHSVPRFTHTYVIYEGAALPDRYTGRLFGVGPLQGHVVLSSIDPLGATFQTKDLEKVLTSQDPWFRPVNIKVGPDGAIYVADFYEQRIDHASHYQGRVTPESGRIYRLRGKQHSNLAVDYAQLKTAELIALLRHENKWHRQIALRLLADRRDPEAIPHLESILKNETGQIALEALWALQLSGGFDESAAARLVRHENPHVRSWVVRLACDDGLIADDLAAEFRSAAQSETNVEARVQLAASARRLPASQGLPILRVLMNQDQDRQDPLVPLMIWWGLEKKADADREAVVELFRDPSIWDEPLVQEELLARLMRRYAQAGDRRDLLICAELLNLAPGEAQTQQLVKGFEEAFSGRSLSGIPSELQDALTKAGGGSLALRLRRKDKAAFTESVRIINDPKQPLEQRTALIQILGQIDAPDSVPPLLALLATKQDDQIKTAALTSLQSYDQGEIPAAVLKLQAQLSPSLRDSAQTLLASRLSWAEQFVNSVAQKQVEADSVSPTIVRKLLFHNNSDLSRRVRELWANVGDSTTDEMRAEAERLTQVIAKASGNPYEGKKLFLQHCSKCHRLFTDGGQIGPDLTSFKRDDLRHMLVNIVNPSLEIREGYENFVVFTDDGRTLNGFISDRDNQVVVLKTADGQSIVIRQNEIDEMQAVRQSIMPERILSQLTDVQVRDLFAYLRATQPLP